MSMAIRLYFKALITDIDPDKNVKESMNRINAAKRDKEAALEEAEAEKITIVKKAMKLMPKVKDFKGKVLLNKDSKSLKDLKNQ